MELKVTNSPFNDVQVKLLNELLPTLTVEQKLWLNGYISATLAATAVANTPTVEAPVAISAQPVAKEVTVLYGSQTGNSQGLAEKYAKALKEQGLNVTVASVGKYKANNLKKETNLLLVVSTQGEGDPPDQAIQFHEFLHSKRAPKLEQLQYSVLALGDSSYEFFCKTGKDFDEQFAKLGATRIAPRVDCDVDYDEAAAQWFATIQEALVQQTATSTATTATVNEAPQGDSTYSRKNPFYAEVLENINLNARGSNKETRHIELSIEGANFHFEPGDSIGIQPENDEKLVDALITALQFDSQTSVTVADETLSLKEALQKRLEITVLSKPILEKISAFTEHAKLGELLAGDGWKDYAYGKDLLDAVEDFAPFTWNAQQLAGLLRKIPARLYSIASSQKANSDEVHLTIGKVSYETNGRPRLGVCSGSVAERVQIGDTLPIYVHKNPNFRLPEQDSTPIIMIGAGTGIAPFRSFLEEREELGVEGKSWLFFGDQHFVTDFLYQTDWQRFIASGVLTNMSVAFSRDTEQKVYVQHKLLENAAAVYEWLEQGAILYVCGDKNTMAADVDTTIHRIIEEQGQKTAEEAKAFVQELKQQNRYQRDVY
ncbi:assimilatory sulfite reductase (NADPH) flavoprotein subunit [Lysinibacillus piscis]|uniref:Sulfite reductase [NADPH] flavoprotein alpha-component n=1 Tax=Lysinibacillus piscis TaxID=2518931 RepID=A0ABQ5NNQ4_9BACI|nr:assimilatory sulfite reductase (NADPH) flavoprotein subunit [Lysinibacillus sp. KH24]GLC89721.1 sulfite reductase [NADPH] flavoprotein alpha-component [Lysinibacillus sp. KH24]